MSLISNAMKSVKHCHLMYAKLVCIAYLKNVDRAHDSDPLMKVMKLFQGRVPSERSEEVFFLAFREWCSRPEPCAEPVAETTRKEREESECWRGVRTSTSRAIGPPFATSGQSGAHRRTVIRACTCVRDPRLEPFLTPQ